MNALKGYFWKLLERFGVQGIQFVLQIILARLLNPEYYGTLTMMIVFINLANVFVQQGFTAALIQNRDVTEEDYSSVFWVNLVIASLLYGVIFLAAPLIAAFYRMPDLVAPLRVLALSLFPGAMNSVQLAKVSREMDFQKVFYSNVTGILIAGAAGIALAFMGGGLWALVVQNLLNITAACIVMRFTVKWKLRLMCNLHRIAVLFRFGWKVLAAGLLNTLEQSLSSLVVGRKYDSGVLAYYNRGLQFPQFFINAITGAMESVLLPAISAQQDHREKVKELVQTAILLGSYIILPVMVGLAGVAEPMIRFLLTEKWLPAVPYMRIWCFAFAFYTVHVCNLQAINAMGRSDLFLKQEIIKKIYGVALLAAAVFFFDSPIAIALTTVISSLISWYVNAFPNKKLIGYSYLQQVADLLPICLITALMYGCVLLTEWGCELLGMPDIVIMMLQILVGVGVYLLLSAITKPRPYHMVLSALKGFLEKKHK